MNWLKILNDFESLVFQLVVLLVLAPKTLFKIAINPRWLPPYLKAESQKDVNDRFDEHVSPIIYWIIFSVAVLTLRVLFIENVWASITDAITNAFGDTTPDTSWTDINLDANRFAQALLISLCYPLAFAAVPVLWVTKTITKKSLELPFYLQCYSFGTFATLCTIIEITLLAVFNAGYFEIGAFPLNYIALTACSIWMFWFQFAFLKNESVKIWAIVVIFILSSIVGTALVYLTAKVLLDIPNSILGG